MPFVEILLVNLGVIAIVMFLLWLISLPLRDASIVDPFWGAGFVVISAVTFFWSGPVTTRKILLLTLTSCWGLRLAGYLTWRKVGEPEDRRYQSMREKIGPRFWVVSLFVVFWLQGVIMTIVALPVQTGMFDVSPLGWPAVLGILFWMAGMIFESVGDFQLARFKANPENEGKVMDRGLWRYTRHPNYFGDFMVWWGIYLVGFGEGNAWWSIVGPLLMSFLLLRVSGVTLLEKSLRSSKEGYQDYVRRTSAFFPLPPKKRLDQSSASALLDRSD